MNKEIEEIVNNLKNEIRNINDLEALKQIKAKYTTKSLFLIDLKSKIKEAEDKISIGKLINSYNDLINDILIEKRNFLESKFFIKERENPILKNKKIKPNKLEKGFVHPLTKISKIVMNFFDDLNYEYAHGIEIESEEINFDALNIPKNHPARTMQDTFYLKGDKLLRTHSTNVTARHLAETNKSEFCSYSIGTVFRNDENDATHSFQFNQIDIFNVGKDITIANLKWTLDSLLKVLFEEDIQIRYRPSYFPFTEPSFEVDIKRSKDKKWIEILGCGMIHNGVLEKAGKDHKKMQGFAAGIGLERIAMLKYGINDIREFTNNDISFLEEINKNEIIN